MEKAILTAEKVLQTAEKALQTTVKALQIAEIALQTAEIASQTNYLFQLIQFHEQFGYFWKPVYTFRKNSGRVLEPC